MTKYLLLLFIPTFLQAKTVDKIVAIVSNEILTLSDVEDYKKKLKQGKVKDDLFEINAKELLSDQKKLIKQLVDEKILQSEIKRKNLEVTKEAVDEEIAKIMRKNRISKAQLKQALKQEGTNYSDYYDFIKKSMERRAIIQQSITSKVRITDEDVEQYYLKKFDKNRTNSFSYNLSHILFKNKEDADSIYKELVSGQAFSDLAEKYSQDTDFNSGGFLGVFKSGEMSKAIESAVKKISSGEFTKPVKTAAGYHIFKINSKKLIPNPDLEEKKERIKGILTQEAMKNQFRFWLDQKRKETYIRINS